MPATNKDRRHCPSSERPMQKTVLLCVVALSVTACNDSTRNAMSDRGADAPLIANSYLPSATPMQAPPIAASSAESAPRAVVKPASAREWAQIQSAASAIWLLADRQGNAHYRLMASLGNSAESLDKRATASASAVSIHPTEPAESYRYLRTSRSVQRGDPRLSV